MQLAAIALSDSDLRQLLRSKALKSLGLWAAPSITGAGFDAADGTAIESLRIQSSPIVAEHASQFAKLKKLRTLTAEEPAISAIVPGLEQLPLLGSVECITPKSLTAISRLKQVKYLYLYNAAELPAGEYSHLADMSGLDQLRVLQANFTPEHFAELAKLPGKRTLYLQAGQTTQTALDAFKSLAPHWTVVLEGCEVKSP